MRSALSMSRSHGRRRPAPGKPGRPAKGKPGGNQARGADAADKDEPAAPQRPTVKVPELLAELEEAYKQLDIRLTYEAIGGELGSGGLCKVKGRWRAIFDKRTTPSERVGLLAPILLRFPWESATLGENVRDLLTRMRPQPPESEPAAQSEETAEAAQSEETAEAAEDEEAAEGEEVAEGEVHSEEAGAAE